ncbi:hypothetical protein LXL04_036677 [Taraxacum kok-saghyz]
MALIRASKQHINKLKGCDHTHTCDGLTTTKTLPSKGTGVEANRRIPSFRHHRSLISNSDFATPITDQKPHSQTETSTPTFQIDSTRRLIHVFSQKIDIMLYQRPSDTVNLRFRKLRTRIVVMTDDGTARIEVIRHMKVISFNATEVKDWEDTVVAFIHLCEIGFYGTMEMRTNIVKE